MEKQTAGRGTRGAHTQTDMRALGPGVTRIQKNNSSAQGWRGDLCAQEEQAFGIRTQAFGIQYAYIGNHLAMSFGSQTITAILMYF